MKNAILSFMILMCIISCKKEKSLQINAIYFGDIKPKGWLGAQMQNDLTQGFVGDLDSLVPELIIKDDIYGKDRMTKALKSKDVGAVTDDNGDWQVQFLWWNSETQSNWWDGYIRNAILTENKNALLKVKKYINAKLETQDSDGYIGVYAPDLRYKHTTENGELWAQSSLFRGLLAYYEYSKDEKILRAVEKAVLLTMKMYPINNSTPFKVEKPYAGVGHGVTFVDVLNHLYQLTGNENYLNYAVFLYEDYNKYELSEVDIQTKNLLKPSYKFKGHGVHTYEHLRALILAAKHSQNEIYSTALEAYLRKLDHLISPSGGPIGDEWILERAANSDSVGYEYCSLQELLDSYALLLEETKNPKWADKMEWLLFNAAQGARYPNGKSIAYCKTDNSYFMQGALEKENIGKEGFTRYRYSPTHKEAAVCCVPNAGRIYPYYVNSMWSKNNEGIVLNLFGASEFTATVNQSTIKITQDTNYPFDFKIRLKIDAKNPETFQIAIRKPKWIKDYSCISGAEKTENDNYILLNKTWETTDEITLEFFADVMKNKDLLNNSFLSYGPLVFGLPIEGKEIVTKDYNFKNFKDVEILSEASLDTKLKLKDNSTFKLVNSKNQDWNHFQIETKLINNHQIEEVKILKPMGNLILRQVTFPNK